MSGHRWTNGFRVKRWQNDEFLHSNDGELPEFLEEVLENGLFALLREALQSRLQQIHQWLKNRVHILQQRRFLLLLFTYQRFSGKFQNECFSLILIFFSSAF